MGTAAATAFASAATGCSAGGAGAAALSDWAKPFASAGAFEEFEGWSVFALASLPDDPFELSCDCVRAGVAVTGDGEGRFAPLDGAFSWNLKVAAPMAADFAAECAKVSTGEGGRFAEA
jgi:hypothetical protein